MSDTIQLDKGTAQWLRDYLYSLCDKDAESLADHLTELLDK